MIEKNKYVMCWTFVVYLILGMISLCWISPATGQEAVPKITPEQMQQCEDALNAAQRGNRPVVLPTGTPGKYAILEEHFMLEVAMIDMKNNIMVLSEQVFLCGAIKQWEDINADGRADRIILWRPVFMTDMEDWYFMPSHPAAGMLHPDDEWMEEEPIPEPPKIEPLPIPGATDRV